MANPVRFVPPDAIEEENAAKFMSDLGQISSDIDVSGFHEALLRSVPNLKPRHPPLDRLPCANVQVDKHFFCENPGTKACGACRLVSYCSQTCQKQHWPTHKQDCKNPLRLPNWQPSWVQEDRQPTFTDYSPGRTATESFNKSVAPGVALWGNTPAIDVINLAQNEGDASKDFSIAFPASGDLRHVVRTVNKLPEDFSGKLTILLNDISDPVAYRNLVLLLILGQVKDEVLAADIALHFWYSVFMPMEYHFHVTLALTSFLTLQHNQTSDQLVPFPLGKSSRLLAILTPQGREHLGHFNTANFSVEEAQAEIDRVKHNPSRRDYRDRQYAKLKPSHRVAFQEFRRFGILLPFGAVNSHFNHPNASLFSFQGEWVQNDFANPLEGWDLDKVISAGKRHGTNAEDIYGCLYFFLSEQLRTFIQRLNKFRISFHIFPMEAYQLGRMLRSKEAIADLGELGKCGPFDRIMVSNVFDLNYIGIEKVLVSWGPLLAKGKSAAIVGYFLNWVFAQPDGRIRDAGREALKEVMGRYTKTTKAVEEWKGLSLQTLKDKTSTDMWNMAADLDAFYDNSQPFATYLKKQGLDAVLKRTSLALRIKHTIVPHRLRTTLQASPTALPDFPDDESWYIHGRLEGKTWAERYVEFSWA